MWLIGEFMIKYADYFPKSMLNKCGIIPDTKLLDNSNLSDSITNKTENSINQLINDIYSKFKQSSIGNKISIDEFNNFNVNRRIVAMLCDLDVISNAEKDKFLNNRELKSMEAQQFDDKETRVSIELPELDTNTINGSIEKSEKILYGDAIPQLEVKGK